jgi:AraC-like DNA-binding protein
MPDGSAGLVVSLRRHEMAAMSGPHSRCFVIDTSKPDTVMGAHFKPGGASAVLGMPLSELRDANVPLEDTCGRSAEALRDCLLHEADGASRLRVLEEWLAERLRYGRDADAAVTWAAREFARRPHVRITNVTGRIGMSSRRFISRFNNQVGLTPKLFCRVQRFQSMLKQAHRADDINLTDLAVACGYFDQAHFTHDFREFAGITPSMYLSARTEYTNHVIFPSD